MWEIIQHYISEDTKLRASKGVAIYIGKKPDHRIKDYSYKNESYYNDQEVVRGYMIIISVYVPGKTRHKRFLSDNTKNIGEV